MGTTSKHDLSCYTTRCRNGGLLVLFHPTRKSQPLFYGGPEGFPQCVSAGQLFRLPVTSELCLSISWPWSGAECVPGIQGRNQECGSFGRTDFALTCIFFF